MDAIDQHMRSFGEQPDGGEPPSPDKCPRHGLPMVTNLMTLRRGCRRCWEDPMYDGVND